MSPTESAPALVEQPGAWPNGGSPLNENDPSVPYGYCHCGCGAKTSVAKNTQTSEGIRKGEHRKFLVGHWSRVRPRKDFGPAPLCACGCGQEVEHRPGGWLKYAAGHYHRSRKALHAPFVDRDPEFWAWFAGFTDGEGCFAITLSRTSGKVYPQPYFQIAVRADERPILQEIQARLECGRIRVHTPGSDTSNLQLVFRVSAVADCLRLVEVFTAHPLRAKKRRDFDVWAKAVREKAANGTSPRLVALRERLMKGREYDPRIAEGGDANER